MDTGDRKPSQNVCEHLTFYRAVLIISTLSFLYSERITHTAYPASFKLLDSTESSYYYNVVKCWTLTRFGNELKMIQTTTTRRHNLRSRTKSTLKEYVWSAKMNVCCGFSHNRLEGSFSLYRKTIIGIIGTINLSRYAGALHFLSDW